MLKLRYTVLGFLLCAIVMSLSFTVVASNGEKTATLTFRDIKITMDGEELSPKDGAGNAVEPFIIDGTTYLPVRGIASALNLDVSWDNATSTVKLSTPQESKAVYITRTGSKYHYDSTCNGGTYWDVPFSTATGMGLEPCEKCVG